VGTVTYGWENNDSIARLPITFTYRSFSTEQTLNGSSGSLGSIDTSSSSRNVNNILTPSNVPESIQKTNTFII
jgi:hypothetical protein